MRQADKGLLFCCYCHFIGCEEGLKEGSTGSLWHALNKARALIPEWVVLWPNSLIAGIYDSVDATGPVAEVEYVGNRERKGVLLLAFSFPPQ